MEAQTTPQNLKIITDDSLMELFPHGTREYALQINRGIMSRFDFCCIEWHWHVEFEFLYVKQGRILLDVVDQQIELNQGEGVFINSKVLHRFASPDSLGIAPTVVFMPTFPAPEGSLIYKTYFQPIQNSSIKYIRFTQQKAWQAKLLGTLKELVEYAHDTAGNELCITMGLFSLWDVLYKNIEGALSDSNVFHNKTAHSRLQICLQYIHDNYKRNITLEDLAQSAMISKGTVLNLFHQGVHTTPITYLLEYRLQESARLLATTEQKINSVAIECGFDNVEYYCRRFKAYYHMTPSQYRREKQ